MSARIFASVTLVLKQRDRVSERIDTLLPLFRAFVNAELASLMDTKVKHNSTKKKVHFCSTNNSSMITPVDTEEGSEKVIENCIASLHKVLQEADNLPSIVRIKNLNILITILKEIASASSHPILLECAKVSVSGFK
jgi:hypothetical protein